MFKWHNCRNGILKSFLMFKSNFSNSIGCLNHFVPLYFSLKNLIYSLNSLQSHLSNLTRIKRFLNESKCFIFISSKIESKLFAQKIITIPLLKKFVSNRPNNLNKKASF